ncbi:MAG: hypothetical protein LDL33_12950 [Desulfomonile sp.]|nr:hypothetical protein [Desulfomonile sp.]
MRATIGLISALVLCLAAAVKAEAPMFGPAEDALRLFKAVRHENVSTRVPSSGKLVAIKITNSGRTYYICREKSGYAIYHLEVRLVEGAKAKIEEDLKALGEKWDGVLEDELVFTKETRKSEIRKRLYQYSEAVWVRNEIILGGAEPEQKAASQR